MRYICGRSQRHAGIVTGGENEGACTIASDMIRCFTRDKPVMKINAMARIRAWKSYFSAYFENGEALTSKLAIEIKRGEAGFYWGDDSSQPHAADEHRDWINWSYGDRRT